jgi:hypothetical protein
MWAFFLSLLSQFFYPGCHLQLLIQLHEYWGCMPAGVGGPFSAIIIAQKENKHICFWLCSKIPEQNRSQSPSFRKAKVVLESHSSLLGWSGTTSAQLKTVLSQASKPTSRPLSDQTNWAHEGLNDGNHGLGIFLS